MKIISVLLTIAILVALVVCNPTTEEFSHWYALQCYPEQTDSAMEQIMGQFSQYLARSATRDDYLICSVYTYGGHTTLGIALHFFPIDELSHQIADLRAGFAAWLEEDPGIFGQDGIQPSHPG